MNPDREDLDITELLSAIGQVGPPSSEALEDAREVLWSAVAEEMLSADDALTRPAEHVADQPQESRQNSSRQAERRRDASPGA
jgi:hypothetical protein